MKKSRVKPVQVIVVTVIILGVVALLWPTCGCAREKARQTTCASDMKQLGLAIDQYAEDNDSNLPNITAAKDPDTTWRTMIYPYAKSKALFQCIDHVDKANGPDGFPRSYAANYTGNYSGSKKDWGQGAFAGPGSKPLPTFFMPDDAGLIVLCEVWHSNRPDFNIDNLGFFNPGSDTLWAGHDEGSNYLLADGHVKYFRPLGTKDYWHRNPSIPLSPGAIKVLQNAHMGEGREKSRV